MSKASNLITSILILVPVLCGISKKIYARTYTPGSDKTVRDDVTDNMARDEIQQPGLSSNVAPAPQI